MNIADADYYAHFNKAFVEFTGMSPDILIWCIREAAIHLNIEMWDNNERLLAEGKAAAEGMDCWEIPFARVAGGHPFIVEVLPYPKGVLIVSVKGHPETIPNEECVALSSDVIKEAPVKTRKEIGLPKAYGEHPENN